MRLLFAYVVVAAAIQGRAEAQDGTAQSFTTSDRLAHYGHRTYSWQRMSFLAADSAFEHLISSSRDWDRTATGYSHRFASGFGGRIARNTIELGVGLALEEDYRYRRSGASSFTRRIAYAASGAALAYDSRGARRFGYSRLAAQAGGSLLAATWRPSGGSPGRFAEDLAFGYIGQVQNNLLSEFSPDLIRFGKKIRSGLVRRITSPFANSGSR